MDHDYVYGSANYTYTLGGIPVGPKFEHEPEIVGYQTFTGRNNWLYNYTSDIQPHGGMRYPSFNVNAYEVRNLTYQYSMYINWQPEASTEQVQYNIDSLRTVQHTLNTSTGIANRLKDSFMTSHNGSAATARLTSVYYAVPLNFTSDNSRYVGITQNHKGQYTGTQSANAFFYKATSTGSLLIGDNILGTHSNTGDGIDGRAGDYFGSDYTAIKTNDLTDNARFFMQSASSRSSDNYVYMTASAQHDEPIKFRFDCVGTPFDAPGLTVNNTASSNQITYLLSFGFCNYRNAQLTSVDPVIIPDNSLPFWVSATANYAIYQ